MKIETWPVFCAKGLAGISNNHLPASLLSRSIPIEMQKRKGTLERFTKTRVLRDPKRIALVAAHEAAFADEFGNDMRFQYAESAQGAGRSPERGSLSRCCKSPGRLMWAPENPPGPMEKALR